MSSTPHSSILPYRLCDQFDEDDTTAIFFVFVFVFVFVGVVVVVDGCCFGNKSPGIDRWSPISYHSEHSRVWYAACNDQLVVAIQPTLVCVGRSFHFSK